MNTEPEIKPIYLPKEVEEAQLRLTEIKFEALVQMFDFAQRKKGFPPQWFKANLRFTLGFIQDQDAYTIGKSIKDAYYKLEEAIKKYEAIQP